MESTLQGLREYRQRHPDFEQAIAKVIEAEVRLKEDPAEGSVYIEDADANAPGAAGPAQRAVLEALDD